MNSDQLTELLALTTVVSGVCEIAKSADLLPKRWAGIAALLLAIGIAFLLDGITRQTFLAGVILGLAAQGLYETVSITRKAVNP